MKITKKLLKRLIKEELGEIAGGGDEDKMAAAQELANTLSQNKTLMAAVKQAAQDPKVQAAKQEVMQENDQDELFARQRERSDQRLAARARGGQMPKKDSAYLPAAAGMGVGAMAGGAFAMGKIGMVAASTGALAAATGPVVASGLLAIALGILVMGED